MRRNDGIVMGMSGMPAIRHVNQGLGFGWSDSASSGTNKMDKNKNAIATKVASIATTDPAFGSADWKILRGNWYDVIHMDKTTDDDPKMQISVVNDINDKMIADLSNPIATMWDNTQLGKWFATTLTEAKKRSGWAPYNADPDNTKLGNRLAIWVYKNIKPDVWPTIANYLSNGPVFTFKEYLDVFGLSNSDAKPASYFAQNPNYDPRVERNLKVGYNTPEPLPSTPPTPPTPPTAQQDQPQNFQIQPQNNQTTSTSTQDIPQIDPLIMKPTGTLPDSFIQDDQQSAGPNKTLIISIGVGLLATIGAVILWKKSKEHEA